MLLRTVLVAIGFGFIGCAGSVPVQMTLEAEQVQVGHSEPTDNYELIGSFAAGDAPDPSP